MTIATVNGVPAPLDGDTVPVREHWPAALRTAVAENVPEIV